MTPINKQWENLKNEYIHKVGKALSSVKHPRSKEVLEDVRLHLDRRFSELKSEQQTPANLQNIINEMGPASDYAELLEPHEKIKKSGPLSKHLLRISIVILIVIGVTFVIRLPYHPQYGPYIRGIFNCNFTANPFFSVKNFNKIEEGKTQEEVLDLIGYPERRYQIVPPRNGTAERIAQVTDEVYWDYTRSAFAGANFYNEYCVIFSNSTGKVLRTRKLTIHSDLKPRIEHTLFPKKVGNLEVKGFDRQQYILEKNNDEISIVLIDRESSGYDVQIQRRAYQREQAEKMLAESGISEVKIFYLDWKEREKLLGVVAMDSNILLYKKGLLYSTPILYGTLGDSYIKDGAWLIRRLAKSE